MLDSSGVVLEQVCDSVRAYLTTREDTVRCIVASLTDDSSNELADVRRLLLSVLYEFVSLLASLQHLAWYLVC